MSKLNVSFVGVPAVMAILGRLGVEAPHAVGRALYQEGVLLKGQADALVPRDTGVLAASGYVSPPQGQPVEVLVGYNTPYALSVHENPRSGKTGGVSPQGKKYSHWARVGQWKYLEIPFRAMTAGFSSRVTARVRQDWLKGG